MSDDDPRWNFGSPQYKNTWDLSYLGLTGTYEEAVDEINKAWPLIIQFNGTWYGQGAWDYGVTPPMTVNPSKLIWMSPKLKGVNPWTREYGEYRVYFRKE